MCEETYNGCPTCKASYEEVVWATTETVDQEYLVDCEGDAYDSEPSWSEGLGPSEDGELRCSACGATGFSLEEGLVPEDCECDECEPSNTACTDEEDNRIFTLLRVRDDISTFSVARKSRVRPPGFPPPEISMLPPEISMLLKRRSLKILPVTHRRGKILIKWVKQNGLVDLFELRPMRPPPSFMQFQIPEPEQNTDMEVAA